MHRADSRISLRLLEPKQKRDAAIILALMVVSTMFEMAAVGAVVPVIGILPGTSAQLAPQWVPQWLAPEHHVYGVLLAVILFFAAKVVFQAFLARRLWTFTCGVEARLSYRLLQSYLTRPVENLLDSNLSDLASVATDDARSVASAIHSALGLFAEVCVVLGIAVVVFLVAPAAGLMGIAILCVVGLGILYLTRRRFVSLGDAYQGNFKLKSRRLRQSLEAVRVLRLLGREPYALAGYDSANAAVANARASYFTSMALPKLWLEFLGVTAAAVVIVAALAADPMGEYVVASLAVLGASMFRLIPSTSRIVNGYQTLSYFGPAARRIDAELSMPALQPSPPPLGAAKPPQDIVLNTIGFAFPGSGRIILENVDLTVPKGTAVGIAGDSGAGKSTLLDIVMGLLLPTSGQVLANGASIHADISAWRRQIGYVPQTLALDDDTLRRNIAYGVPDSEIDDAAIWRALSLSQLDEFVRGLPAQLDTPAGDRGLKLSGGQRQRLGIARALYTGPAILVLDEPTSHLDAATSTEVMRAILGLRPGVSIVVATHSAEALAMCDQVYRLGPSPTDEGES
jgi:ATP-binding cassette, subfamily B, bacterial PglK